MDENVTTTVTEQTNENTPSMEELQAELAKLREENGKLKNAQSNASADASKYKRQLQERMTEQERAANETKELIEKLKSENAQMKRSQAIAEQTTGFLSLGLDATQAKKAAEVYSDGNFSALMETFKDFITAHDKALNADALRNTPRPGVGATQQAVTKEEFDKMPYAARLKIYEEQPDLYKELTK